LKEESSSTPNEHHGVFRSVIARMPHHCIKIDLPLAARGETGYFHAATKII
jgi:hypothetical protein